jgi:hypothetical protein
MVGGSRAEGPIGKVGVGDSADHDREETSGMIDYLHRIRQAYDEALDQLEVIAARRPSTWPPARPVSRYADAVRIDAAMASRRLRRDEQAWVDRCRAMEAKYQAGGGDVADLHRLAAR